MSTMTIQYCTSCGHCAGTILDAVRAVQGVDTVSIDIQNKSVVVTYAAPADEGVVQRALRKAATASMRRPHDTSPATNYYPD